MDRRTFMQTTALGLAGAWGAQAASPGVRRPNILFITSDDQGVHAGCYGDGQARTPVLDQLAREGLRFSQAFVTQASCSPSRSSMLTGRYPHENGQIGLAHLGYKMHPGQPMLPDLLRDAGYYTGIIGKLHVADPKNTEFDFDRRGLIVASREVRRVAREANAFLTEAQDKPFFLMVNLFDPHRPYEDADQIDGLPAEPQTAETVEPFPFQPIDDPKVRAETATYYNGVSRLDTGVGMLLELLEKFGHAENTLVVFVGDHGPPFTRGKTTCYEAGVHVPLLMRWPGQIPPGMVSPDFVSTIDLLPTMCAAAGVPVPELVSGMALQPLWTGKGTPWRDRIFTEMTAHTPWEYYPRRAIRDSRYKLIENLTPERTNPVAGIDGCAAWEASRAPELEGAPVRKAFDTYRNPPRFELYDLETDPVEFHNLAGQSAYAGVEARLKRELLAWRTETKDPLLDPAALAALNAEHEQLTEIGSRYGEPPKTHTE